MKRGDDARDGVTLSADLVMQICFKASQMFESRG
jgi:hypothetical protein